MKISEIREKTEKDLMSMLLKTKEDLQKTVVEVLQGKSKDTSKLKRGRRELARLKTILNQKKNGEMKNMEVKQDA